jgi:hypothetical protein
MRILFSFVPLLLALCAYAAFFKLSARILNYRNLRWSSCFGFTATLLVVPVTIRLLEMSQPMLSGSVVISAVGLVTTLMWGSFFFNSRATRGTEKIGWSGGFKLSILSFGLLAATGILLATVLQFAGSRATIAQRENASNLRSSPPLPMAQTMHPGREQTAEIAAKDPIDMVFARNMSAINSLYTRELRTKPGLRGKLVLDLTISAAGEVEQCNVQSSELDDSVFEATVAARVKKIQFGPQSGGGFALTKEMNFTPSRDPF